VTPQEEPPPPTVEGRIIRVARLRVRPHLSIPAAAEAAGVSERQWGDIERGYARRHGRDAFTRITARADTLARMTESVPLSEEELEEIIAARPDAARLLRGTLGPTDAEAADKLIEAFIASVPESHHRDVLEWRWRMLTPEGKLRPRSERIADLNDWVTKHMMPAEPKSDAG
jgi:hypothetical protein